MTLDEKTAKRFMFQNYAIHVDPLTGELNLTGLAEDTIDRFGMFGLPSEETDFVFYWASEVESRLAKIGKVKSVNA